MDSSNFIPESSLLLSSGEGGGDFSAVHLLVIGLSGAGKSNFVSKATGDTSILVGNGNRGVTRDVQDHIMYHNGTEIHLIDTPGFDDCALEDHDVLVKISDWINTVYAQGWRFGGIIYIYDVTRARLGGAGELNIRLLEGLTGKDRWQHISLVTNKWGWSRSPENERQCEVDLKQDEKGWKALLKSSRPARMHRFMNNKASALKVIQWHLDQSFEPAITYQMADPAGPQLSLGDTDPGKLIRNCYAPALARCNNMEERARLDEVLSHKFDSQQMRFALQGMLAKLQKAKREDRLMKVGRWAVRLTMIGGCIVATLVTENPACLGVGLATGKKVETKMQRYRQMKKDEIAGIEAAILDTLADSRP